MSNTILLQDDWTYLAGEDVSTQNTAWAKTGVGFIVSTPNGTIENTSTAFSPANTITQDVGTIFHYVECSIDTSGSNVCFQGGPVVMFVDFKNFICVEFDATTVNLRRILNGGSSPIGPTVNRTHVDGDVYRLERDIAGDAINLYVNGDLILISDIVSQPSTGTRIGVTNRQDGVQPPIKYGPLKSGIVVPTLRSLRWRDIQRWSNATEGYALFNAVSLRYSSLNQNIDLLGNFEVRQQLFSNLPSKAPLFIPFSSQQTDNATAVFISNNYTFKANNVSFTVSGGGNFLRSEINAGRIANVKIRRVDGILTYSVNDVVIDSREFTQPVRINAFHKGSNSLGTTNTFYLSMVVQNEFNEIPFAFLPYSKSVGRGRVLENQGTGPNGSYLLETNNSLHNMWVRYNEGTYPNQVQEDPNNLVLEEFPIGGASGLGIFAFMMWQ